MKIRLLVDDPSTHDTPLLVLSVFEEEDANPHLEDILSAGDLGIVERARESREFRGEKDGDLLLHARDGEAGPRRTLLLGAGKKSKATAETVRRLAARAVRRCEALSCTGAAFVLPEVPGLKVELLAQAASEGGVLAGWKFAELQAEREDRPHRPVETFELFARSERDAAEQGMQVGRVLGEAENLARTLQNRPGNVATPTHLAEVAASMAAEVGLEVAILGPEELESERMHALLAVSRGSFEEPRLIVLEHRGGQEGDAPVALVGKGLTFDAGGISIKPSSGMEEMKYDMSGGAAVIAAMRGIAELDLPLNVIGVVPASENLPSGTALKPGDVIRTRAGKTVEVINTDAEGRLILADALAYVLDHEPAAIVDCATLTGSCVVALGDQAAALLGTDEELLEALRDAGERSGERCWPLPLWEEYRSQLDSEFADFKNVGGRPAGTITAAHFLREFVGDVPWAHLDIAGTAYGKGKLPYRRDGGFGVPTRLLLEWVRSRAR